MEGAHCTRGAESASTARGRQRTNRLSRGSIRANMSTSTTPKTKRSGSARQAPAEASTGKDAGKLVQPMERSPGNLSSTATTPDRAQEHERPRKQRPGSIVIQCHHQAKAQDRGMLPPQQQLNLVAPAFTPRQRAPAAPAPTQPREQRLFTAGPAPEARPEPMVSLQLAGEAAEAAVGAAMDTDAHASGLALTQQVRAETAVDMPPHS